MMRYECDTLRKEGGQNFVIPPFQYMQYVILCIAEQFGPLTYSEGYDIISNDLYVLHIDSSILQR